MLDDPETLLFTRFRDRADVDALGRLYDATAAELLRVATHLVRDPGRAEDLVQQTFVAAIEAAARFDASRRVRAWLLGILANLARKLQREQARAPVRPAESGVDPAALAATEEFTAQVDAAISTLPEVYQPVLVLHLKHGMVAAEIAHALRRPPGTVRTQIVRGLELLKQALPASIAFAGCVLFTPLRGLAAVKQIVLANAAAHVAAGAAVAGVGTAAAGAVAGTLSLGGAVLMKKYFVALALVVLAVAVAFGWPTLAAPDVRTPEPPGSPALVRAALPDPNAGDAQAATAGAARAAVEPTEQPPALGTLRCRFLWESDRTPAAGVAVHCMVWGRSNPFLGYQDVVTDANGEIALERLEPGTVGVYVDRSEGLTSEITPGATAEHTYLIPQGVTADVAVQDEQGQPIPAARVWLSHYGNGTKGHEIAITNAAGRAVVRDIGEGRDLAVRADGYTPTPLHSLRGAKPGERLAITMTMVRGNTTLRGLVLGPDGGPCAGARVWIGDFSPVGPRTQDWRTGSPPPFELIADAHGRFAAAGLPVVPLVVKARAPGTGTHSQVLHDLGTEVRELELRLEREAIVAGTVRDDEGRPVAGAHLGGGAMYGDFGYCSTTAAADGSYQLCGLSAGRATIGCSKDELGFARERRELQLTAGERHALDVVLVRSQASDQVRGRVVDEQGAPLAKWIVDVFGDESNRNTWSKWLRTDAEGRFVAKNCPFPQVCIHVFDPDGAGSAYPIVVAGGVRPGGEELLLHVPATATRFALVTGTIVGADGKPLHDANVVAREPGAMRAQEFAADARGTFRAERLPPRRYLLEVQAAEHPTLALGEHELAPDQQLDLGTVVLPRGGHVDVMLRNELPGGHCWAVIHRVGGPGIAHLDLTGGRSRSDALVAGRYFLLIAGQGVAAAHHGFTVVDGTSTTLTIELQRGRAHTITVREPRAAAWSRLDLIATDAAGNRVWGLDGLERRGDETLRFGVALGVGSWQVSARTDTGLSGVATVHVADVAGPPVEVALDLR